MEPIRIIDRGRGPELDHIRITVFDILPYLQSGWHPTSVAAVFGISTAEVDALVQYIHEHEPEVLAENQKIVERIDRGNAPEVESKRRTSREKILALRAKLEHASRH
jgi:uncharacterized protein (DUF433 family)